MTKIVYQGKGQQHKKYIRDAAYTIWKLNGGGDHILWSNCIREAMRQHREYIASGDEVRVIEIDIIDPFESEHYSG